MSRRPAPVDPYLVAAVEACREYARKDAQVRALSRLDPGYTAAARARDKAHEVAVVSLQRNEPRAGLYKVTTPIRVDDLMFHVDSAGELRKEPFRVWKRPT